MLGPTQTILLVIAAFAGVAYMAAVPESQQIKGLVAPRRAPAVRIPGVR